MKKVIFFAAALLAISGVAFANWETRSEPCQAPGFCSGYGYQTSCPGHQKNTYDEDGNLIETGVCQVP